MNGLPEAMGKMVGAIAYSQLSRHVANSLQGSMRLPIRRVGAAGLIGARVRMAHAAIATHIQTMSLQDPVIAIGTKLPDYPGRWTIIAIGNHIVVIELAWSNTDLGFAAAQADGVSRHIESFGSTLVVSAVVSIVRSNREPLDYPGPSGRDVTVVGDSWLAGILARRMANSSGPVPPALHRELAAAQRRFFASDSAYWDCLESLPPTAWWVVPDLWMDDTSPDLIDLVVVGNRGLFAFQFVDKVTEEVADTHNVNSFRIHQYGLPQVCPVLVLNESAQTSTSTHSQTSQLRSIVLPNSDAVLPFIQSRFNQGLADSQLAFLNYPFPFWSRQIGHHFDGRPQLWVTIPDE